MRKHVNLSMQMLIIHNLYLIENLYNICTIYTYGLRKILHQIDHGEYIQKYQLPKNPLYMKKQSKMMQVNDVVKINNNFLKIV
jgi:hypothetical protein